MTDLILWSVMLWAGLAILLHLGLIGYATICRNSNWWGSPWEAWGERLRWSLAWIISGLVLLALVTGCACPCRPKIPLDPISRLIPIPTLDLAAGVSDGEIGINCEWRY